MLTYVMQYITTYEFHLDDFGVLKKKNIKLELWTTWESKPYEPFRVIHNK